MKRDQSVGWSAHPQILPSVHLIPDRASLWEKKRTKHEGEVWYEKRWNFWVRAGVTANSKTHMFFPDYDANNRETMRLLGDTGYNGTNPSTEMEIWARVGTIWDWCKEHVRVDSAAYGKILPPTGTWPSILDYAAYYAQAKELVWAACFSKAQLFLTLLGRQLSFRHRLGIAEAHHTENGAPPTATHVYVAAYITERWFYFDPTAVYAVVFPGFNERRSVGVDAFNSVDYTHPYAFIPLPNSGFNHVPYVPA